MTTNPPDPSVSRPSEPQFGNPVPGPPSVPVPAPYPPPYPPSNQVAPAPMYPAPMYPAPGVGGTYPTGAYPTRGMYTAAAVLNWITLGIIIIFTAGIGIIAAAWFIPMTILIHKGAKGPYKHTALGVCTLLFCNLIGGILMLADDSNRPMKPMM